MSADILSVDRPGDRQVTVIKRDIRGQETYRYHGVLLMHRDSQVVLQAYFDRDDLDLHGMPLARGDRFVETYYTDRWYNIFEIHAHQDDILRGWYCNICQPAEIDGDTISYIDLSLDLLVFPDGRQIVLDEDEFEALVIVPDLRQKALQALHDLQGHFSRR